MAVTITGGSRHVSFGDDDTALYTSKPVTVVGGNGDDTLVLLKKANVTLGDGSNAITMAGGGQLNLGSGGNDTITLGVGKYTVSDEGTAYVDLLDGSATVNGGTAIFTSGRSGGHGHGGTTQQAVSGDVTMVGGTGPTTFIGGSDQDTMVGGGGRDTFRFDASHAGGDHIVQSFVVGDDKLFVEKLSYSALDSQGAISFVGADTQISLSDGTNITVQGVHLSSSDIVTR